MNVKCPSCEKSIRVTTRSFEKLAGKNFSCPGCSQPVRMPMHSTADNVGDEVGNEVSAPETSLISPPLISPPAKAGAPADISQQSSAPPLLPGVTAIDTSHASSTAPPSPSTSDLPKFQVDSVPRQETTRRNPKRTSIAGMPLPVVLLGGSAVLSVLFVLIASFFLFPSDADESTKRQPKPTDRNVTAIEFRNLGADRKDVKLTIDGDEVAVPRSSAANVPVKAGQRKVRLVRRGYEPIDVEILVTQGDKFVYRPAWVKNEIAKGSTEAGESPPSDLMHEAFAGWFSDYELAKVAAAEQNKNILIVFCGSDWSAPCRALAANLHNDTELRTEIDKHYVRLFCDYPTDPADKRAYKGSPHHEELRHFFEIAMLPTVVMCDQKGRPLIRFDGLIEGGRTEFRGLLAEMENMTINMNRLCETIEESAGQPRVDAVMELSFLLNKTNLLHCHLKEFQEWYAQANLADPRNETGELEAFMWAQWRARFREVDESESRKIEVLLDDLEQWTDQFEFKDHEIAARIHMLAAFACLRSQDDRIAKFVDAGISFEPQDLEVANTLSELKTRVVDGILGSGSGFLISTDGYILTNHHVVESGNRIIVTPYGFSGAIPAKVVATSADPDLALLKIDMPSELKASPLPIIAKEDLFGEKISAFGFPGGGDVTITQGTVSSVDRRFAKQGMLLLDCRINPGNSGGPLCNSRGEVVGVVAAKTFNTAEEDSYGMAVPGDQVLEFLRQKYPKYAVPPEAISDDAAEASIAKRVRDSVVLIHLVK